MGTWGTDLYSDDIACEVRDEYLEALKVGLAGPEAANQVLHRLGGAVEPPDSLRCLLVVGQGGVEVPFSPTDAVWLSIGRIASEIDRRLGREYTAVLGK